MKLGVLALDYDGTIATNDRPDSSVLSAIAAARSSGAKVLRVTGRILTKLRRVAGGWRLAPSRAGISGSKSGHRPVIRVSRDKAGLHPVSAAGAECDAASHGVPHRIVIDETHHFLHDAVEVVRSSSRVAKRRKRELVRFVNSLRRSRGSP